MNRRCILLLAVLSLGLGACASTDLERRPSDTAPNRATVEHQLLVMLRLPAPHFRPDANYGGSYDTRFGRDARRRIAMELADQHRLTLIADWPMPALGVDCFVMAVPPSDSAAHLAEQLTRDPRVESAQPMRLFHTLGHNDPLYSLQPSAQLWHLAELHRLTTGRNVPIAEIDSGVELEHPDLRGQIVLSENFVDDSPPIGETHGTAVAGIIVARADNWIGIAGVAPQARLLVLRACWQENDDTALCTSFTLAKALQFAIDQHVKIINLSLAGPRDRLLKRLLDAALVRGIVIVSAADPGLGDGGFPASHPGVLAVAADGTRGVPDAALLAPGRDIPTTIPGGRWSFVTGSSFATAHVTGLIALLLELSPQLQPQQVRDALASTPTPGPASAKHTMIDACAAITRAAGTCACGCATTREARLLTHQ